MSDGRFQTTLGDGYKRRLKVLAAQQGMDVNRYIESLINGKEAEAIAENESRRKNG